MLINGIGYIKTSAAVGAGAQVALTGSGKVGAIAATDVQDAVARTYFASAANNDVVFVECYAKGISIIPRFGVPFNRGTARPGNYSTQLGA